MEAQELVNALKRRGYTIGLIARSPDGFPAVEVNGRMMKFADAEKLLKPENSND